MIEHRVVVAAVADDDPGPAEPGFLEQRAEALGMLFEILVGVHQDEAGALAVQMKHRLIGHLFRLQRNDQIRAATGES